VLGLGLGLVSGSSLVGVCRHLAAIVVMSIVDLWSIHDGCVRSMQARRRVRNIRQFRMQVTESTGCKYLTSVDHSTTLSDYIFATKECVNNWKELVKQQYLLHIASLGYPCKFQWVTRLNFITVPMSLNGGQSNFAHLAVSWAGTLYIHFRGLLPPNGILPGAKIFTS